MYSIITKEFVLLSKAKVSILKLFKVNSLLTNCNPNNPFKLLSHNLCSSNSFVKDTSLIYFPLFQIKACYPPDLNKLFNYNSILFC